MDSHIHRVYLAIIPLLLILPCVNAITFVVADGESPSPDSVMTHDVISQFNPETVNDHCVYFYGGKCQHTIITNLPVTSCTGFKSHSCEVSGNRSFILSYPGPNTTVPNTPSLQVIDSGMICFGSECLPYNTTESIYNFNWRAESTTGISVWVLVSPNGYNVIPILLIAGIIYFLWAKQDSIKHRYDELR